MYNRTTNASDSIDSYQVVVLLVEEQTDKVVMGGKFSRGDGGKPSDAKGGYQLGCQQLASHISLFLACCLKCTSEIETSTVKNTLKLNFPLSLS